jgi:hypothetical protein
VFAIEPGESKSFPTATRENHLANLSQMHPVTEWLLAPRNGIADRIARIDRGNAGSTEPRLDAAEPISQSRRDFSFTRNQNGGNLDPGVPKQLHACSQLV